MDMWDHHPWKASAARVDEMAGKVNKFIEEARNKGALIIHSPSDCGNQYDRSATTEERGAMDMAATALKDSPWCQNTKGDKKFWDQIKGSVPIHPNENKDGGSDPTRQTKTISVRPGDAICAEGFPHAFTTFMSLIQDREELVYVGVATNMCILNRYNGQCSIREHFPSRRLFLVRDLTDVQYEVDNFPKMDHFLAIDYVVDWISWTLNVDTLTSDVLLGGDPFRFQGDTRPRK
jgi:hypothetical protein